MLLLCNILEAFLGTSQVHLIAKLVNMILKGKQSQDAVTIAKQEAEMRRLVNIQQAFAEQLRVQYANNDQ